MQFPYLDIQEAIEFYAIFDGYPLLHTLQFNTDIFECIQRYIIEKHEALQKYFLFDTDADFQADLTAILSRIAKGDRKIYSTFQKEKISQIRSKHLFQVLFSLGIIQKEKTREKPLRRLKSHPIKKALRHYVIQDKLYFQNNFTRFWFTYCYQKVPELLHVQNSLDKFTSFCFEYLSNALIIHQVGVENIEDYGSYWDKNNEIDLLTHTKDGIVIAGESKWKNTKICKNILNALEQKCFRAGLHVNKFALFSKSGFSKELMEQKREDVWLFDITAFKELYD
ncbi:MAG: hypothetical protein IBX44_06415 [Sulfurospirillum sp.]|nr:hypothetical protein [Sulfurospirillum sp.]